MLVHRLPLSFCCFISLFSGDGRRSVQNEYLMSFVIALYVVCLVSECILLIKYRIYIDLGLKSTVASRFCYYFAFIGMAVGFMLPKMGQDASGLEQYYNPAQSKAELVFSSPDEGYWLGLYPAVAGLDGFLRWAYNSWPRTKIKAIGVRCWTTPP